MSGPNSFSVKSSPIEPEDLALIPVVQGAGGVFTNWEGSAAGLHSGSQYIAAGDPRAHEQALKILSSKTALAA